MWTYEEGGEERGEEEREVTSKFTSPLAAISTLTQPA